jgi:hypothetical protein
MPCILEEIPVVHDALRREYFIRVHLKSKSDNEVDSDKRCPGDTPSRIRLTLNTVTSSLVMRSADVPILRQWPTG